MRCWRQPRTNNHPKKSTRSAQITLPMARLVIGLIHPTMSANGSKNMVFAIVLVTKVHKVG